MHAGVTKYFRRENLSDEWTMKLIKHDSAAMVMMRCLWCCSDRSILAAERMFIAIVALLNARRYNIIARALSVTLPAASAVGRSVHCL